MTLPLVSYGGSSVLSLSLIHIYNPSPLSLLGQEKLIRRLAPGALRLAFTLETPEQMKTVLDAFADQFLHGEETRDPFKDFTRGHFKRGVELSLIHILQGKWRI